MNYFGTFLMQRPAISAVLLVILLRNVQANNNKSRDLHVTNNSKNFTIATDLRNIENQERQPTKAIKCQNVPPLFFNFHGHQNSP